MSLLGAPEKLGNIPGFNQVIGLVGNFIPNPISSTYVVSHNYFAAGEKGITDRGCTNDQKHGAHWGENNLGTDTNNDGPGIDYKRRKCFDTAPFRDTSDYDRSQYRALYRARGPFFMGCQNPQADNPAVAGAPEYSGKDKHNKKATCEIQ
jgi:hypothetical protein